MTPLEFGSYDPSLAAFIGSESYCYPLYFDPLVLNIFKKCSGEPGYCLERWKARRWKCCRTMRCQFRQCRIHSRNQFQPVRTLRSALTCVIKLHALFAYPDVMQNLYNISAAAAWTSNMSAINVATTLINATFTNQPNQQLDSTYNKHRFALLTEADHFVQSLHYPILSKVLVIQLSLTLLKISFVCSTVDSMVR